MTNSLRDKKVQNLLVKIIIALFTVFVIYLFMILMYNHVDNSLVFPHPRDVLTRLRRLIITKDAWINILGTFKRLIVSVIISFLVSLILAILAQISGLFRRIINPYIVIFRTIPLATIICVLIIVMGISKSVYIITALMLIPLQYEGILNGFLNIDKELNNVWKLDSKYNFMVFYKVTFPLSKYGIITSLVQSVGLGFKVLVMAEFIAHTKNSIGLALISASNMLEYVDVFAWSIILVILSVLLTEGLKKLEKREN